MTYRFYNAQVLAEDFKTTFDGEVHVNGKIITYAGPSLPTNNNDTKTFDREIDCKHNLLMPGLKNSHTHVYASFGRSMSDNLPLQDWLEKVIWPSERKLNYDDAYVLSLLGFAEALACGTTGMFDMYAFEYARAQAAIDSKMRLTMCDATNNFGGIDAFEENFLKLREMSELISPKMGFHAEYTTSPEIMKKISEYAHKYEQPVYTHLSETRREVDECIGRYGKTPTEALESFGLFDYGGGCYHCVYLSDNDIEIFKKRKLYAVMNAGSNLKLASGIAPFNKYSKQGIKLAIGTDGSSSNNAIDMFREMYLVSVLSKVVENDASAVDPIEVLKAATINGCECMQIDKCGLIKEGYLADMIMIDMTKPCMQPELNTPVNLVYSGNPSIVKMTMVNGEVLYENGNYLTIDMEYVISKSNAIVKRLYS